MSGTDTSAVSSRASDKHRAQKLVPLGLCLLIVYAVVRSFFAAAGKPFWYDEICTFIVARQSSISAIWKALARGADSHPPPFYLVERAGAALVRNPEIGLRLPAIVGIACVMACIFSFVKRRAGAMYGLLCTAIPLITVLYSVYAEEARAYCLLTACIAVALVCYQRLPEAKFWLILLGITFVAAESLHYYAVFALVPFGLAEITLSLRVRRLRPTVWLALGCGVLPLVLFWPLLFGQKKYYGAHFWGRPTLRHAGATYAWLFGISNFHRDLAIAVVLVLVGGVVAMAFRRARESLIHSPYFHEYVLVWALLGLPFVAFAATKIAGGGYDARYVLPCVLAIPLGAGYILPKLNRKIVLALGILIFGIFIAQETRFWISQRSHLGEIVSPVGPIEHLVSLAGHSNLPVVLSDGHDYPPLVHYASPERAGRFVALVDPAQAVAYIGTDTLDKNLIILRSCYPLQVYEFQDFAAKHRSFLLYSAGGMWDWWPRFLAQDGYSLEEVAAASGRRIYLVTHNGDSPRR